MYWPDYSIMWKAKKEKRKERHLAQVEACA
jgi:hypothetical protein